MITYPYVPTLLFEVLRGFQIIVYRSDKCLDLVTELRHPDDVWVPIRPMPE